MKPKNLPFFLLVALLTLGCAAARQPRLSLPNGGWLDLTVPGPMPAGQALTQHFRIDRGRTRFEFEGQVELEPQRLTLIGLTPLGSRGFSADWSQARLSYDHLPFYNLPLSATELLGAWQMAFMAPTELGPALAKAEAELVESADGRLFKRHGQIWAQVRTQTTASGALTQIDWLARGFRLTITTRASETYPL